MEVWESHQVANPEVGQLREVGHRKEVGHGAEVGQRVPDQRDMW